MASLFSSRPVCYWSKGSQVAIFVQLAHKSIITLTIASFRDLPRLSQNLTSAGGESMFINMLHFVWISTSWLSSHPASVSFSIQQSQALFFIWSTNPRAVSKSSNNSAMGCTCRSCVPHFLSLQ